MTRRPRLGALLLSMLFASTSAVVAQDLVVPPELGSTEAPGYAGILQGPARLQDLYDASCFTNGPIRVTAIRFRRDYTVGGYPVVDEDLEVTMSTSSKGVDGLSNVFADNHGPDVQQLFRGTLRLSSTGPVPAGGPAPFDIEIPLAKPFDYDPSQGNLLVELRSYTGTSGLWTDGANSPTDQASRCWSYGPDATMADVIDSGADVLQLVCESLPPGPFALRLSASPTQLWPPHGQRVPVTISAVADTGDGRQWKSVQPHIVSVTCNEVFGKAARDTRNPQWIVTGDLTLNLVAKKLPGRMNFRVYTITVEAEGRDGFVATAQVRVVVPPNAPRR